MKNLKELTEKYKDVGLGYILWGGKGYYEINSDERLSFNSYGGTQGFVLNDKEEVEIYNLDDTYVVKRTYYLDENWTQEVFYATENFYDETDCRKWWGKTLDNYYPHPWYPEKKILAFETVGNLPFNRKGTIEKVVGEGENSWIELESADGSYDFTVSDCLECPEFFKPIYE